MAQLNAADEKELKVSDVLNGEKDNINVKTDEIYGQMWDSDDYFSLSEEGRCEFLKKWCEKQKSGTRHVITALKNLELERIETEVQYHKELAELELNYQNSTNDVNQKRADIIRGTVEPELAEAPWMENERKMIEESLAELEDSETDELEILLAKMKPVPADAKGIPGFWLHILKNIEPTEDMIETADEPVLEKLYDIKVVQENTDGFVLEFYFEENEYFTNDKLYKTFKYEYNYDKQAAFEYDGPYIKSCTGCTINWLEGKNLTVRNCTRRLRKKNGQVVTMQQLKNTNSFFNFFKTPKINNLDDCSTEEDMSELRDELDLGDVLKNDIIPKAVLYYTGNITYDYEDYETDYDSESYEQSSSEDV